MNILVGQKNNIYVAAFTASTKTLTISNVINFSLNKENLVSVYDLTTSAAFNFETTTFSYAYVQGLPVYSWVFDQIPAGAANSDTLNIIISIPDIYANYSVLQYIAGATV